MPPPVVALLGEAPLPEHKGIARDVVCVCRHGASGPPPVLIKHGSSSHGRPSAPQCGTILARAPIASATARDGPRMDTYRSFDERKHDGTRCEGCRRPEHPNQQGALLRLPLSDLCGLLRGPRPQGLRQLVHDPGRGGGLARQDPAPLLPRQRLHPQDAADRRAGQDLRGRHGAAQGRLRARAVRHEPHPPLL